MPEGWDSDRGGMTVILFVIGANIDPFGLIRTEDGFKKGNNHYNIHTNLSFLMTLFCEGSSRRASKKELLAFTSARVQTNEMSLFIRA